MSSFLLVIAICAFLSWTVLYLCHDLRSSAIYKREVCERFKEGGESGLIMGKYFMNYDCYRDDRKWVFYAMIVLLVAVFISVLMGSVLEKSA